MEDLNKPITIIQKYQMIDEQFQIEVGRLIRSRMRYHKYSNDSLGAKVGVSGTSISNIALGKHRLSISILVRIGKLLDFTMDDILSILYRVEAEIWPLSYHPILKRDS